MNAATAPSISVIVPCHDNGPFVAAALESVLAQTLPVRQIVFVDDACTDDSVAIARRVSPGLIVVHGRYGTCGAARNAGLTHATGELIAFLDADDVWPPDSLAARYAAMQANAAVISFGRVRQTWLDTGEDAKRVGPEMVGKLAGSMLIRREVFDRVGVFDETLKVSEAIDWTARAIDAGVSMASCEDLVLYRRVHRTNTMRLTENVNRLPLKALRTIVARRASAGGA